MTGQLPMSAPVGVTPAASPGSTSPTIAQPQADPTAQMRQMISQKLQQSMQTAQQGAGQEVPGVGVLGAPADGPTFQARTGVFKNFLTKLRDDPNMQLALLKMASKVVQPLDPLKGETPFQRVLEGVDTGASAYKVFTDEQEEREIRKEELELNRDLQKRRIAIAETQEMLSLFDAYNALDPKERARKDKMVTLELKRATLALENEKSRQDKLALELQEWQDTKGDREDQRKFQQEERKEAREKRKSAAETRRYNDLVTAFQLKKLQEEAQVFDEGVESRAAERLALAEDKRIERMQAKLALQKEKWNIMKEPQMLLMFEAAERHPALFASNDYEGQLEAIANVSNEFDAEHPEVARRQIADLVLKQSVEAALTRIIDLEAQPEEAQAALMQILNMIPTITDTYLQYKGAGGSSGMGTPPPMTEDQAATSGGAGNAPQMSSGQVGDLPGTWDVFFSNPPVK